MDEANIIDARFKREASEKTIYKVDLSCRQWKRESLDIIAPYLKSQSKSVRFVNLADVIAGLMTDEGLGVTQLLAETFESSDLFEIDLSDNAMGPRGLVRSEAFFANSSLQNLYLSNCGLSAESMNLLNDYFTRDNERMYKSLKELVLDKNMIGEAGARTVGEFLPRLENLEYFSFNGCRPNTEGTKFLCDGLMELTVKTNCVLRRIEMEDCTFGSGEEDTDPIISFCSAIAKCSRLQRLNINEGSLEIYGIKRLVSALKEAKARLTHLSLGGTGEYQAEGAAVLAEYLHDLSSSLIHLNLDFNELGDDGVAVLVEAFAASRNVLEVLSLNGNEIESVGAKALVRTDFPNLKRLSLDDNMDIAKDHLKSKYGPIAVFGDNDDEESEAEPDSDMDTLLLQFAAAKL
ncbi:unnamed protein product [Cylindrotheca closterium]|uniref:Ran GTPase-activating protein 1 n=1 Tax=Cylindrotheca closterium TaxID=2856 RepID=A0AAD2CEY5_9STRA|nr:unnamed protein product [Cylindrotheca closterium]